MTPCARGDVGYFSKDQRLSQFELNAFWCTLHKLGGGRRCKWQMFINKKPVDVRRCVRGRKARESKTVSSPSTSIFITRADEGDKHIQGPHGA